MKKAYTVFLFVIGFMLFGCFSRDDDYYSRRVRLTITDAVEFGAKKSYVVGDTMVFELKFSRYLKEEGYDNLLDIYETTDSEEFGYNFDISKFSDFSNSFERINIDQAFILGTRTDQNYSGYYGGSMAAVLDTDKQGYTSKVGVILVEQGRFRIDLEYFTLNSGYDYENQQVEVEIEHVQTPENEMEAEFTVTEN